MWWGANRSLAPYGQRSCPLASIRDSADTHSDRQQASSLTTCLWDFDLLSLPCSLKRLTSILLSLLTHPTPPTLLTTKKFLPSATKLCPCTQLMLALHRNTTICNFLRTAHPLQRRRVHHHYIAARSSAIGSIVGVLIKLGQTQLMRVLNSERPVASF